MWKKKLLRNNYTKNVNMNILLTRLFFVLILCYLTENDYKRRRKKTSFSFINPIHINCKENTMSYNKPLSI